MRKSLVTSIWILCAALLAGFVLADEHTTDSFQQIGDNLNKKKALLVDVREPQEQQQGFITGAVMVPLSMLEKAASAPDKELQQQILQQLGAALTQQMPKDKILYTYCASGVRCVAAGKILTQLGYDVRPLKSSYRELVAAGYPQSGVPKAKTPGN